MRHPASAVCPCVQGLDILQPHGMRTAMIRCLSYKEADNLRLRREQEEAAYRIIS